jgi:nucleotide-binding universal stress UspA family protein
MPPRRLLIAVDDSEASEAAVRWTVEHLYRGGDEVHLVG